MSRLNETHDASLTSWVASANTAASDFPIQNLPFAVFRRKDSGEPFRGGLAIGDQVNVVVDKKSKRMVIEAATSDIDREVLDWTDTFIKRYRPALDALSKK